MSSEHQLIDDEISRAAFDLLLKEPFYAHVLAGMPRVITKEVKSIGLHWDGQAVLRVNPEWFRKKLTAKQCGVALKHEILHVVFRHLLRPGDRDPAIYSIAADLVVNQLLLPLRPMRGWPVLGMFPEMQFEPDQPVEIYYTALATLFRTMQQAGFDAGAQREGGGGRQSDAPKSRSARKRGEESGPNTTGAPPDWIRSTKMPESAKALAALLADRDNKSDDSGWFDGKDGLGLAAGQYAVGSLLLRARHRMPPHQWGSLPATLLSHLDLIAGERRPKLDWKRMVRLFCASSGRTCIKHTVKRVSKRYGTRPGIKVQRLQRLLVAVDTSGSIDQEMLDIFFTEIDAAWRSGASVHVVECDAAVGRDYRYTGKPPREVSGGGGTDFEPVFRWMQKQRPFDGCLYLTDGFGGLPKTPPRCRLLWVVTGDEDSDTEELPFGTSVQLRIA
jgi:predicted metal-dependent peptidase